MYLNISGSLNKVFMWAKHLVSVITESEANN